MQYIFKWNALVFNKATDDDGMTLFFFKSIANFGMKYGILNLQNLPICKWRCSYNFLLLYIFSKWKMIKRIMMYCKLWWWFATKKHTGLLFLHMRNNALYLSHSVESNMEIFRSLPQKRENGKLFIALFFGFCFKIGRISKFQSVTLAIYCSSNSCSAVVDDIFPFSFFSALLSLRVQT